MELSLTRRGSTHLDGWLYESVFLALFVLQRRGRLQSPCVALVILCNQNTCPTFRTCMNYNN